jgi:hypothetical protein
VQIQRLLDEGLFVATYKFALLQSLADIAIEQGDDSEASLAVSTDAIAEKQMWAEEVNRRLKEAQRPERVDHRSLEAQRKEALQNGDLQKATELDRAPQVKLGWKVVQMERRGTATDRGDQLRAVKAENLQRQALLLDIGKMRAELAQRQEAARPAPAASRTEENPGAGRAGLPREIPEWPGTPSLPELSRLNSTKLLAQKSHSFWQLALALFVP